MQTRPPPLRHEPTPKSASPSIVSPESIEPQPELLSTHTEPIEGDEVLLKTTGSGAEDSNKMKDTAESPDVASNIEVEKIEADEKLTEGSLRSEAKIESLEPELSDQLADGTVFILLEGTSEEFAFFFPIEQTLAIVKPDAYANREEIIEKIKAAGFHIAVRQETHLTPEMAREIFSDMLNKPFINDLIAHMCRSDRHKTI
ncbi:unnamed protein product [Protopolystoma xenopodis]|uniref:Nucleoside diphosphate kinase-like domain-containing protein n=1 Tax=Protopolystoma xenopodis TaxID=117903 RepID=A0A3S5A6Y1_9PLAT|nr:unnamed protein product [Protopolystoma xenopodis]